MIEYINLLLLLTMFGSTCYIYYRLKKFFYLISIVMDSEILDQLTELGRDTNTYVYAGSLSVLGLAIGGYLLYGKFKKPERKLIDVLAPPVAKTNTEPKRDIFEMY